MATTWLQILPMENVHGREIVEGGNLCERKNGRGVDSNRNWPVHWGIQEKDYDPSEEFPGSKPFRYPRNRRPPRPTSKTPVQGHAATAFWQCSHAC